MYLRTTRRKNKDGTVATYYQLAHNFRHPKTRRPTVKIIHNFGRAETLDRDDLVRLCRSIARVCGVEVKDPLDGRGELFQGHDDGLPETVRLIETRELGTVYVIEALWERLGVGPVLRNIERKEKIRVPYERALFAMTANRLCEPESKLGVWDRWLSRVHLPSASSLKLPQMYAAMDLLRRHAEEVEESVFFKTADLFSLTVDLVFYDVTSATFEIDEEDPDGEAGEPGLRKYGKNSEGVWKPQVKVALAVTREGLPVRSWVFPGNTTDVKTVSRVKKDLRGWKLGRALFVGDGGMNSTENREDLAKGAGKYILATRMGGVKEVREDVLNRAGRYTYISESLRAKEVTVGDGELRRRYIVCWNPQEEARQRRHREAILAWLEEELPRHPSQDATLKWAIELLASRRYGRYLKVGRRSRIEIDYAAAKAAGKRDGKWVLMTNDDTLGTEDAATGYRGLMVIERCFRAMKKTRIRMLPMHHRLRERIEGHVKICVLALLISRAAELATGRSWEKIRSELRRIQATEFRTPTHQFCQRNELRTEAAQLLQALDMPAPTPVLDLRAT